MHIRIIVENLNLPVGRLGTYDGMSFNHARAGDSAGDLPSLRNTHLECIFTGVAPDKEECIVRRRGRPGLWIRRRGRSAGGSLGPGLCFLRGLFTLLTRLVG